MTNLVKFCYCFEFINQYCYLVTSRDVSGSLPSQSIKGTRSHGTIKVISLACLSLSLSSSMGWVEENPWNEVEGLNIRFNLFGPGLYIQIIPGITCAS